MILGLDSNIWLASLDDNRRSSADGLSLEAILESSGLRLVSTPGVATHRSGTVIDIVAVSSGVLVRDYVVHAQA
jgi:hypothetical protein